jgi:heterodisulfide reductase subunit C/nitrate reductase gamma subunit
MTKQILFSFSLILTIAVFAFTVYRLVGFFRLTKRTFPIKNFGARFKIMMDVAIGQTKIFRRPVIGLLHALVFWGFCVIVIGSIEMIIDGLSGSEKIFKSLGIIYKIIIASGDIFGLIVAISILVFLARRLFFNIARFKGIEMKSNTHIDANVALSMIFLLMVSLLGMNSAYYASKTFSAETIAGVYPVSSWLSYIFTGMSVETTYFIYETCWWIHILLIFIFANILPYSKHFHVFMSVPNVFLSRLEPLGKLYNMDNITREVKLMLDPDAVVPSLAADAPIERFGVKDCEDVSWKNYFDSLSCTQCGRCTSVCPANITGKKLSPRKIIMDLRTRMNEKGPGLVKNGKDYTDQKSLLRDYITEEELWACTTCNACARECPININQPSIILDMRRYLVMEEGSAPGNLKSLFSNIENNGAPWQFSPEDRLLWTKDLEMKAH